MDNKIDDTYIEAFEGIFCRVIVTADDLETLCKAAADSTATPSVVIGRTEGGVEQYLSPDETLTGVSVRFCSSGEKSTQRKPSKNHSKV